jgi:AcrR family transcriptional regulator
MSPPPRASAARSPRAARREREQHLRRADVVAAALAVFAERGFHDAQVSEIARRAEVSLASVYALFGGKEALFQAAIETTGQALRAEVEARVAEVADPGERLLVLVEAMLACFDSNEPFLRIFVQSTQGLPWQVRQSLGDVAAERMREFIAWVIGLARDAARAGRLGGHDPEAVALALIGSVTTAAAHHIESGSKRRLSTRASSLRALFAPLLSPPPRKERS